MESILKQLLNPEWWFTAVFVGLLMGVISAYAKDWIGLLLGSFSSKLKVYIEEKRRVRRIEIDLLSADKQLLLIEYMRAAFQLFGAVAMLAGSSLLPAWSVMKRQYPELDPIAKVLGLRDPFEMMGIAISNDTGQAIASFMLGAIGIYFWNGFLSRHTICERARRKLSERKGIET